MRFNVGGGFLEFCRLLGLEAFIWHPKPSVIPGLAPNQTQLARFHAEFFRLSALFSRSNRFYTQFILRILAILETIILMKIKNKHIFHPDFPLILMRRRN